MWDKICKAKLIINYNSCRYIYAVLFITAVTFTSDVFAVVDDEAIADIDSKATSANAKADGNNSRIQALEADDIILHQRITDIQLTPGPAGPQGTAGAPGADGVDGAPGADGVDGAPGPDGVDGASGPAGADGVDGLDGSIALAGQSCSKEDPLVGFDATGNIVCSSDIPPTPALPGTGADCTTPPNLVPNADLVNCNLSGLSILYR